MGDPYAVLGVDKNASAAEIKSAFRTLAKKYHPDANPDNARAQERFGAISRAYEIVGDEDKRKQFDRGEIDADGKERATYPGGNPFAT
ncbi:MAG: DnaJ domain-containing protein, partial [Pseudomonadota bacterium]